MRTYRISFTRLAEPDEDWGQGYEPVCGPPTVSDETEFDVTGDDPAELLVLFGDFIAENGFSVEGGFFVEEIKQSSEPS